MIGIKKCDKSLLQRVANTTKRDVTECDKLSKEVSNKQKASICSSFESFERYRFPSKKS